MHRATTLYQTTLSKQQHIKLLKANKMIWWTGSELDYVKAGSLWRSTAEPEPRECHGSYIKKEVTKTLFLYPTVESSQNPRTILFSAAQHIDCAVTTHVVYMM
jgi:hypothetical protein